MRQLVIALALAVLASACGSSEREALPADEAAQILENRNWIDHWPESANEQLYVYRFTPHMGGGVFQDRTLFAGKFELFTYKLGDEVVDIRWPHTKTKSTVKYTIRRVKGPKPFDLRLDLEGSARGPAVYFGRSSETHAEPLIPHLQ
jgi:hypothetical protein